MAFADIVEVSCSGCHRRYAVADHKVTGRLRQSRCRCGCVLVFDGRHLPQEGDAVPPAADSSLAMDTARSSLSAEPHSIGRIQLRKPSASEQKAPTTVSKPRLDNGASNFASDAEGGELQQALEMLAHDLDSIADRIRPEWELTPHSKRVSAAGAEPEVVVHYPPHWQPPPSERRRLREQRESRPSAPVSQAAPSLTVDALDDGWAAEDGDEPVVPDAPDIQAASHTHAEAAIFPAIRAPEAHVRQEPPRHTVSAVALTSDSTAPAALSRPPSAKRAGSKGGLWAAAGLAALTLVGVFWRSQTPASHSSDAGRAPAARDQARPLAPAAPPHSTAAAAPKPGPAHTEVDPPEAKSATLEPAPSPIDAPLAPEGKPKSPAGSRPAALEQSPRGRENPEPNRQGAPPSQLVAVPRRAEPAPSAPLGNVDHEQVRALLAAAASRARTCSGNEPGSGTVRVLLDPAGGVLNATVTSGPFQGTAVGNCVERTFENAKTAPYRGRSLSTAVPFTLPGTH